jgi:hypothetical protein
LGFISSLPRLAWDKRLSCCCCSCCCCLPIQLFFPFISFSSILIYLSTLSFRHHPPPPRHRITRRPALRPRPLLPHGARARPPSAPPPSSHVGRLRPHRLAPPRLLHLPAPPRLDRQRRAIRLHRAWIDGTGHLQLPRRWAPAAPRRGPLPQGQMMEKAWRSCRGSGGSGNFPLPRAGLAPVSTFSGRFYAGAVFLTRLVELLQKQLRKLLPELYQTDPQSSAMFAVDCLQEEEKLEDIVIYR